MEPNAQTTIEDPTVPEPGCIAASVQVDAQAQYRSDLVSFGWLSIAKWSILAAGVYPLLMMAIGTIAYFAEKRLGLTANPASTSAFLTELIRVCLFMPLFAIACLLWSVAIAVVTLPTLHLVIRSLEICVSFIWLGAFTGGLLIFLALLPVPVDWLRNAGWWDVAHVLLMGPALATIVCQTGGAYGGLRAARRAEHQRKIRQTLVQLGWRHATPNSLSPETGEPNANDDRPWFQFRTAHLLWVAAWISVLLALIRFVGYPFEIVLPLIFGWLLYQSLTLWLGGIMVRRLAPWWTHWRQGRST